MPHKIESKHCPQCGIEQWIRADRTYCSTYCANIAIGERKVAQSSWKKWIVAGDIHIPFHDERAVKLFLEFVAREKPDGVVLNGDIADQYEVSTFSKDPQRKTSLAGELAEVRGFLGDLRTVAGDAEIRYVCGNHEHRMRRYIINQAPQLAGLRGMSFEEQCDLERYGIQWVPCSSDSFTDTYTNLGNFLVGHFNKVSKHSAYTAKLLLDEYGMSLLQAHVHSMGFSERKHENGFVGGWEGGCLCSLNPTYCKPKNWMHGWHVVYHEIDGDAFYVEPVMMINHKYWYGGKLWS